MTRLVIHVEGGTVSEIFADHDCECWLIDHDVASQGKIPGEWFPVQTQPELLEFGIVPEEYQ